MITNNFGREFLGEQDSEGTVELSSIKEWIDTGLILDSFENWKKTNDEGEEHHKPGHKHKRKKFKRAPAARRRSKKDL